VDEKSIMQILMYASLAQEEGEVLEGHIWVERQFLEVQNMKYYCPSVLRALLKEQQGMVNEYLALDDGGSLSAEEVITMRKKRDEIKERLNSAVNKTTPLKWVNRVIMWCADKMPSFGDSFIKEMVGDEDPKKYELKKDGTPKKPAKVDVKACIEEHADKAKTVVNKAMFANTAITQTAAARDALLKQYYKAP